MVLRATLLPERESKLRGRLAAAYGLREGQSFELLRVVGRELAGAVEARSAGVEMPNDEDAFAVPAHQEGSPSEAGASRGSEPSIRLSALAGLQLKFSMSMVNERLTLSARSRGSQWIVKLAGPEYAELAEVEATTMTWAKQAGFDVPVHRVVPFDHLDGIPDGWAEGTAPAFAVRRFDRREDGSKVHQEDLCQALDLRPRNKYGNEVPRVAFEGALRLVYDACGEADAREMARRVRLHDRLREHRRPSQELGGCSGGDRARPTLAPCYDLVATIAWERMGWERKGGPELALGLGRESLFARVGEPALETCAREAGYPWIKQEILAGIDRARDAWGEVEESSPARMRAALENALDVRADPRCEADLN